MMPPTFSSCDLACSYFLNFVEENKHLVSTMLKLELIILDSWTP